MGYGFHPAPDSGDSLFTSAALPPELRDFAPVLRLFSGPQDEGILRAVGDLLLGPVARAAGPLCTLFVNASERRFIDFMLGIGPWSGMVDHWLQRDGLTSVVAQQIQQCRGLILNSQAHTVALKQYPEHGEKIRLLSLWLGLIPPEGIPIPQQLHSARAVARFAVALSIDSLTDQQQELLRGELNILRAPILRFLGRGSAPAEELLLASQYLRLLAGGAGRGPGFDCGEDAALMAREYLERAERSTLVSDILRAEIGVELAAVLMDEGEIDGAVQRAGVVCSLSERFLRSGDNRDATRWARVFVRGMEINLKGDSHRLDTLFGLLVLVSHNRDSGAIARLEAAGFPGADDQQVFIRSVAHDLCRHTLSPIHMLETLCRLAPDQNHHWVHLARKSDQRLIDLGAAFEIDVDSALQRIASFLRSAQGA